MKNNILIFTIILLASTAVSAQKYFTRTAEVKFFSAAPTENIEAEKDSIKIFFSIQGGLSDSPYWLVARDGVMAPVMTWKTLK